MTWIQTTSGRAYDLVNPTVEMVDFKVDVPEALSRIARFTGHVSAGPYSVGQHCIVGADYIYRKTKSKVAAGAFLVHDSEEMGIGDIATPIGEAMVVIARAKAGEPGAVLIKWVLKELKHRQALVMYAAAGIPLDTLDPEILRLVKQVDLQMLATERRHLMGKPPKPWVADIENCDPLRLNGSLKPWPWPQTADAYRQRISLYLPDLARTLK